ncbi:MAG: VOC family protein [Tenericutes bacterium]|nr:VOC family protein [Mycoplasmatota bacterium]
MKQVNGIHHVTAITSSAEKIYDFFTNILSMRLVKKTVNQDDIQTYHLFFADDEGNAGTDMTFFDFNGSAKAKKGTNEIAKTSFRVPNNKALKYWKKRFEKYDVKHYDIHELFGVQILEFEDFDGQEYVLFSDENDQGIKSGVPWKNGPVPIEFGISGLGPIFFRVDKFNLMDHTLVDFLSFKKTDEEKQFSRYQTGLGGNGASVIVIEDKESNQAVQGYGGIHHVAFRVDDKKDISDWIQHLNKIRAPHSGEVDRFYFTSLYTRLYPGLLFEFATEGPGFIDDEESYETLGELLALPPKFRDKREQIEKMVRHIETKRSNKVYKKEYLGFE